jgi:phosphoglycolate phosphatase-like HAD superfamily hydrolase
MQQQGLTVVIASSAQPDELESLLKIAGIADLVEATTSSGDVEKSKPDPDIVQAALEKLGYPPDEVLMLGDSPYDVEAASKVKVRTVALRCGGFTDKELKGALSIYDDPAALVAAYESSPFAVNTREARTM